MTLEIDRTPITWMNWAPVEPTPDNPRGYVRAKGWSYLEHAYDFVHSEFARGDRYVARLERPTIQADGNRAVPSSVWHPIAEWRRNIIIAAVQQRKAENPNFRFGLYMGSRVGNPLTYYMTDAVRPAEPGANPEMGNFLATVIPWLEATGLEAGVILDAASDRSGVDNLDAAHNLSVWCARELGIKIMIESYPCVKLGGGRWAVSDYLMPMWCLSRFPETRDPNHEWSWDPATTEVHVANSPHGPLNAEQVEGYRKRGYIVGSARPVYDWSMRTPSSKR